MADLLVPDEDKHLYLYWSIGLIFIAVALLAFDKNLPRAFAVAGAMLNLAGALWIAAGVVLRASDLPKLDLVSISGLAERYTGRDPIKEIIPNMLRHQSRRAKFGAVCVSVGTGFQVVASYIA